jgi:hypothetical protein
VTHFLFCFLSYRWLPMLRASRLLLPTARGTVVGAVAAAVEVAGKAEAVVEIVAAAGATFIYTRPPRRTRPSP